MTAEGETVGPVGSRSHRVRPRRTRQPRHETFLSQRSLAQGKGRLRIRLQFSDDEEWTVEELKNHQHDGRTNGKREREKKKKTRRKDGGRNRGKSLILHFPFFPFLTFPSVKNYYDNKWFFLCSSLSLFLFVREGQREVNFSIDLVTLLV